MKEKQKIDEVNIGEWQLFLESSIKKAGGK